MSKHNPSHTEEMIADIFNGFIKGTNELPKEWKSAVIMLVQYQKWAIEETDCRDVLLRKS